MPERAQAPIIRCGATAGRSRATIRRRQRVASPFALDPNALQGHERFAIALAPAARLPACARKTRREAPAVGDRDYAGDDAGRADRRLRVRLHGTGRRRLAHGLARGGAVDLGASGTSPPAASSSTRTSPSAPARSGRSPAYSSAAPARRGGTGDGGCNRSQRLIQPVAVHFDEALVDRDRRARRQSRLRLDTARPCTSTDHEHAANARSHHHDHNLAAAYLHVVADALTSVLAIVALLGGKYFGWVALDAHHGIWSARW